MSPVSHNSWLRRIWAFISIISLPLMLFAALVCAFGAVGLMQRVGWIAVSGPSGTPHTASKDVDYICPMMCVPPVKEPGRCPKCDMELVPVTSSTAGDRRSVLVDSATRRIANITTVEVKSYPVTREIQSVGEISYDEGSLRAITAYASGRIEDLFVDYTGAVVEEGDRLAVVYSPQLHSAVAEYLQAMKAEARPSGLQAVAEANRLLRANTRQKLVELGLNPDQIKELERAGKPGSRLDISAPLSGTVIERMAVQGETVKEGQPLFRLADLSSVWLILELFPQDASAVRYGQKVQARVKSLAGQQFEGRIAFISPNVSPTTRTVSVRVVIDNSKGQLRIGDYVSARIAVPVAPSSKNLVFDPDLADKWISPRHPHIISDAPGSCPVCGGKLVPAQDLGFTSETEAARDVIVVPRTSVLHAAGHSVVYVETDPGRFEIRHVQTGTVVDSEIVISKGLEAGEKIAVSGGFLLDSQMQLAGNPSLIDPNRLEREKRTAPQMDAKMLAAIRSMPMTDQQAAMDQVICPVTEFQLGSMGVPPKASVDGRDIFLCCEGCRGKFMKNRKRYVALLERRRKDTSASAADGLSPESKTHGDGHLEKH